MVRVRCGSHSGCVTLDDTEQNVTSNVIVSLRTFCELLLVLHTPEIQISLSLNALCVGCFVIFSVNE